MWSILASGANRGLRTPPTKRWEGDMEIVLGVVVLLLVVIVVLQILLLRRRPDLDLKPLEAQLEAIERAQERAEHGLREEVGRNRDEFSKQALSNRQELQATLTMFAAGLTQEVTAISTAQHSRLELLGQQMADLTHAVDDKLNGVRSTMEGRLQATADSQVQQLGGMRDTVDQVRISLEDRIATVFGEHLKSVDQIRTELAAATLQTRTEMGEALTSLNDSLVKTVAGFGQAQSGQLTELTKTTDLKSEAIRTSIDGRMTAYQEQAGGKLDLIRTELTGNVQGIRAEVGESLKSFNDSVVKSVLELGNAQSVQLSRLTETTDQKLEIMRNTVHERLQALQEENTLKLEQIRHTVDEQLQSTLDKRLGDSFKVVSDRLEQVHRGLGEMQTLASGVGDLKKLLGNVRVRGTWGEVQLGMLLEQMLTPEQYGTNIATTGTGERVEFAIKLPGSEPDQPIWLPIDAKFPKEDYERLLEAVDRADASAVEESARQLELRVRQCAKDITQKYVAPPKTTDFAVLYLPTEGLYAEVLRRPGLIESLQHDCRVTVAGPTTLAALLNSLQMGFRTLAIQQRSSEVWEVLGVVKTEFAKYAAVLEKVHKKLEEATHSVDSGLTRTRVLQRKLRDVQELASDETPEVLDIEEFVREPVGVGVGE
jgi:DNA recombination protein RmuC